MKRLTYCLVALFVVPALAGGLLIPVTSVTCSGSGQTVSVFNFDLYPTGHPMSGVGMFSGMFEVKTSGVDCGELRGHIRTRVGKENYLLFVAESNCVDNVQFVLNVPVERLKPGVVYDSILEYSIETPFGLKPGEPQNLKCILWTEN